MILMSTTLHLALHVRQLYENLLRHWESCRILSFVIQRVRLCLASEKKEKKAGQRRKSKQSNSELFKTRIQLSSTGPHVTKEMVVGIAACWCYPY
jgi:hypothetical protein